MKKPLIIGVGNKFRGDDAAGLEVAQSLEKDFGSLADFAYCSGDAIELMDLWLNRDSIVIVDAVASGTQKVGYLHKFLVHENEIPASFSNSSTHLLGIAQVIELARALGKLPKEVILYGIEGNSYYLENSVSQALESKLPEVTKQIEQELKKLIFNR